MTLLAPITVVRVRSTRTMMRTLTVDAKKELERVRALFPSDRVEVTGVYDGGRQFSYWVKPGKTYKSKKN